MMRMCVAVFMTLLLWPLYAIGFDDVDTHPRLTKNAIESSNLNSYLIQNLGISEGISTKITSTSDKTIKSTIEEGSKLEDSPTCRASNHFHDPTKTWTESGVTDQPWVISTWCSASGYYPKYSNVTWATGYCSPVDLNCRVSNIGNDMDWDSARKYYLQALTSTNKNDREANFAKTFQAVGQVLHLLEDMAVPAHTRNDFTAHLAFEGVTWPTTINPIAWITSWFGNSFEYYVKNNPGLVSGSSAIPSFTKITDYWDTDGSAVGLAELTNANYFSDFTIPNNNPTAVHAFPNPQVTSAGYQICVDYAPGSTDLRRYISRKDKGDCPSPSEARTADHFAAHSLLNEEPEIINNDISTHKLWLDNNVHDTYAKELLPKAVGYSAGLLNYFFRGQINMEKDPQNVEKYIIKNESGERMEGTFILYYDDINDNRRAVANWNLSINANDKSGPVSFTAPISPEPKEYGEYMLVFNGQLGNEEGAVGGREIIDPTSFGRVVRVSNYWGSRGNIRVYTKKGEITGQLPSAGLSDVRAVRFDVDDWNTFMVMALYYDYNDPFLRSYYEFHKYSIDEAALTLTYQGVVLKDGPWIAHDPLKEKIYEKFYPEYSGYSSRIQNGIEEYSSGAGYRIYYYQENRTEKNYVDFFIKGEHIKPFGVVNESSESSLGHGYYTVWPNGEWTSDWGGIIGNLDEKQSSMLYFGEVLKEITPINCTGAYYYGDPPESIVGCQPKPQSTASYMPMAIFNSSDYAYAYNVYPFNGDRSKQVISTLPVEIPQDLSYYYDLKTMLRENGEYSFYTIYPGSWTASRKSYSSEIGTADCSGFLITDTQVGDGYLGWQSSGKIVSFENCSDWQPLGRTGSSGSNDYKFDVILNYQP